MASNVVPIRAPKPEPAQSAAAYETRVHFLALRSDNIRFGAPHFQEQLKLRKVTMRQVLETLRHGSVVDGPTLDEWGDWRVKLQRRVAGRRVQVVVAVKTSHLDAVTVI